MPAKSNTTLKQVGTQRSDAEPGMQMRLPEDFAQLEQPKQDVGAFFCRKRAKLPLHGGIDEERLFQELSSD